MINSLFLWKNRIAKMLVRFSKSILLLLFFLVVTTGLAQKALIKGKVTDEKTQDPM